MVRDLEVCALSNQTKLACYFMRGIESPDLFLALLFLAVHIPRVSHAFVEVSSCRLRRSLGTAGGRIARLARWKLFRQQQTAFLCDFDRDGRSLKRREFKCERDERNRKCGRFKVQMAQTCLLGENAASQCYSDCAFAVKVSH
jgi:hypothetical protein